MIVNKRGEIFDFFGWDFLSSRTNLASLDINNKSIVIGFIQPLGEAINSMSVLDKFIADGKAIGKLDQNFSIRTLDDYPTIGSRFVERMSVSNEFSIPECLEMTGAVAFEKSFDNILVVDSFSLGGPDYYHHVCTSAVSRFDQ